MKIKLSQLQCLRCGHFWSPRKTDIRTCPKCRSALWDLPKEPKSERTKVKE